MKENSFLMRRGIKEWTVHGENFVLNANVTWPSVDLIRLCTKALLFGLYHTFLAVEVKWCRAQKSGDRMEKCYLSESYTVCPDPKVCPSGTPHGTGSINNHRRASQPTCWALHACEIAGTTSSTSFTLGCWAKATTELPAGLAHTTAASACAGRGTWAECLCFCLHSLECSRCSFTKHFHAAIVPLPRRCCCWAGQPPVPF